MNSMKQIFVMTAISMVLVFGGSLRAEVVQVGTAGGEWCVNPVPYEVAYRPSLYECNGAAAILFRGTYRNAYSVVLRRNGAKNDRDRFNPDCALASCSPFKVQKRIELPEYQVNCLGDTGYSGEMALANRISIKFRPDITNARDPNQFQQYCLVSKTTPLN